MTTGQLCGQLDAYLALRRALGFAMRPDERLLRDFLVFLDQRGVDGPVRAQAALEWATAVRCGPGNQARRLTIARRFLTYVRAVDPRVDVPGPGLLGHARRSVPHVYTPVEILALIEAARTLGPRGSLRPHTMATLIGVLASCGLRAGEPSLAADGRGDRRPATTAPHSTDEVPEVAHRPGHATTADVLRDYAAQRQALGYEGLCDAFFVSERGGPLNYHVTAETFVALARCLGLRGPGGVRGANLHQSPHTFERLAAWSRARAECEPVCRCSPSTSVTRGRRTPTGTSLPSHPCSSPSPLAERRDLRDAGPRVVRAQVSLGASPSIQLHGKGRKKRAVPLWARTARVLRGWFSELGEGADGVAFPRA